MFSRVCILVTLLSVGSCEPDPGQPLYLTPYIEAGRMQEARSAAKVEPLLEGIVSYSGYLTIDKRFNSNLFFWFFPSEESWESRPVLLWLQGGPGVSSLLALLYENGPIQMTKKGLKKNPYSWSKNHNIIYIDNPVGTGFSFTNSSEGYPRTQNVIGDGIYKALLQFFTLFPELRKNPFFLSGESYAGKYVPSSALAIHINNQQSQLKINLQGLIIGNGMVDPINMLHYGEYLYQLGLIDRIQRVFFEKFENETRGYINEGLWNNATDMFSQLIMDHYYSNRTLYNLMTGLKQHYNYVNDKEGEFDLLPFTTNSTIRKTLHVGNNKFDNGKTIALALKEDIMKSMKSVVESLLEHYDFFFYNGQLDIVCAYPLTANVLQGFNWSRVGEFQIAMRQIWTVNGEVAGYCRSGGGLTDVLVRNAGHLAPSDQPAWLLDLISWFTSGYKCEYF